MPQRIAEAWLSVSLICTVINEKSAESGKHFDSAYCVRTCIFLPINAEL